VMLLKTDVVMVTYRNQKGLKETIDYFNKFFKDQVRLIVVNNDVRDKPTVDYLESLSNVKTMHLSNVGCAEGYNTAFEYVKSDWFVRNDDDMLPDKELLGNGYAHIEKDIGIIGTRTVDKNLNPFFTCRITETWKGNNISHELPKRDQYSDTLECVGLVGTQLINADKFEELGGYDEVYFPSQWEDHDLCTKMISHGYKCLYLGHLVSVHNEEKSNAGSNPACGDYYKLKWYLKNKKRGLIK